MSVSLEVLTTNKSSKEYAHDLFTSLEDILRGGARKLLQQAIENEV